MLQLKYIDGKDLTVLAAAIANAISPELRTEDLILLSDLLAAVGVNLTIIAAQRTAVRAAEERTSLTDTNEIIAELRRKIEALESGAK